MCDCAVCTVILQCLGALAADIHKADERFNEFNAIYLMT